MSDKPKSVKAMLREAGIRPGGSVREELSREIDDSLFSLWSSMAEQDAEGAAIALFALLCRDPNYRRSLWISQVMGRHKVAIMKAVDNGTVRRLGSVFDAAWQ